MRAGQAIQARPVLMEGLEDLDAPASDLDQGALGGDHVQIAEAPAIEALAHQGHGALGIRHDLGVGLADLRRSGGPAGDQAGDLSLALDPQGTQISGDGRPLGAGSVDGPAIGVIAP